MATDWLYSNAVGGVKLFVPEDRHAEAIAVLDTFAESVDQPSDVDTAVDASPDTCRSCGGPEFEAVVYGRRWAALSWLVAGFPFMPVRRAYQCRKCKAPLIDANSDPA
ncbi:hypothetical protein [Luteitalea sp.]